MAEANGHDVPRGQIRERSADGPASPRYKRQKSERTILADRLEDVQLQGNGTEEEGTKNGHHESEDVASPGDETDGARRALRGLLEDSLNRVTGGRLFPQIGFERDNVIDEQFENNIVIRHRSHIDGPIRLGIHFRRHENSGFIVQKVLEDGLLANKDIRAGDILTHVEETDVQQMSLAKLQRLFWDLTFETKITLKILRVSESDDETDGASVSYEKLVIDVKVTVKDDSVRFEAEIVERSSRYMWGQFPEDHFYISVLVDGNPRYLCAQQQDMTIKAAILTQGELHNLDYHWRQQWCTKVDGTPYRLLYNVGTEMTVSSGNIESGEGPFIVKMSTKSPFEKGSFLESTQHDVVFKGLYVTEGKDNYYLEAVSNPAYYMCLSSDPGYENCLEMATESSHPKTEFHFDFLSVKK